MYVLEVTIEKKIGDFALKAAFSVQEGEVFGLLGESGCGKSMTLRCIAGIETPDSGKIILNGKTLFDSEKRINLPPQKRKVGYLFQDYALFPNMTVYENLKIVVKKPELVEKYLKQFYLSGLENHYPSMLSGGQKQRCAIARMMAAQPELLLFDEPFSAVDQNLKWNLELQVKNIMDETKKPAIFVTHNRQEIDHFCQRAGILSYGEMKEVGRCQELFHHPKTAAAAKLSGCKNVLAVKDYAFSYVGIPQEAMTMEGEGKSIKGVVQQIFLEKDQKVLAIQVENRILYYEADLDVEIDCGEEIHLAIDPEKIWKLSR